ncbi:zinc finger protein 425 isoform X2 [Amyelois transitella]|uniref:zinc finger protein 425 isoform X2 n=1 Tax=Amyelois transitella TaxID=680683 RepID=UPI00298FF833|nr:zinc finger protein 425 isoform X2 [Amyelois transitella]
METVSSVSLGSICEGCLSVDRKLTPIIGEESDGFHWILESLDHVSHTILLCWECAAMLRRTLRFREQVKNARDSLVRYMLHQTILTSLSCLGMTKNDITLNIIYNPEQLVSHTEESKAVKYSVKEKRRNTQKNVQTNNDHTTEPVAFIKIEEKNDYDDDIFDDPVTGEAVNDKDVKAVLKSDSDHVPVKRRKRRKTKEYSFDESDDEPLKKKAEGKRGISKERPAGVVENARVSRMLSQLNVRPGQLQMVLLSWEQIEEERKKALSSEKFTRHEFRCDDCALGFNHRVKLDDHMRRHDPANGTISCSVCNIRCKDAHALCSHRRRHRVRWRCCSCGALFSRAGVAADHAARAHAAPPPDHRCRVCHHVETTLGKLRIHMKKTHSERQNCEHCGKSFRDKSSLKTHLFIHRGEKDYACTHCDKKFLFKKALEVHLVTHDAPQHLYCHQCDVNFKNQMSYYQHMRYNLKHIDPANLKHACTICGKRFAKSSRLSEHRDAVHLKRTPVACDQPHCTFSCSSRPVLRTHLRMVHRNGRSVRNHVCHTCGKSYTTKKILEGHIRSHTGERPFCCALCPATFGYDAALYNHNKLVHLKQSTRNRAVPATEPWAPTDAPRQQENMESDVT